MRSIFSEKNLVIVLFVMVLIIFSLAQEDSRKLEQLNGSTNTATHWIPAPPDKNAAELAPKPADKKTSPVPVAE